jgi:hypothetical protein
MPDTPDRDHSAEAESISERDASAKSDGPLRIFSEQLGIDFDAVVERAKKWAAENPLPSDLGPEPFNVGRPRPPVD